MDWAALVFTLWGSWRIGSKERDGFWLMIVGNLLWAYWGTTQSAWSIVVINAIFSLLNIRGLCKWKKTWRPWRPA